MTKFEKYSKTLIYTIITINILIGILVDIIALFNGISINNISVIIMNIIFLILYTYTEKFYHNKIKFLPNSYYYIALIFSFLAMYLGSFLNYYEKFFWWDNILHFTSGILIGFLSIVLVNILFDNYIDKYKNKKDLLVIIVVAFFCAVSVGVFWEFYEYSYDFITDGNMQRSIYYTGDNLADFLPYIRESGRFIDPGLTDTMNDLFLATSGAIIASIISYIHIGKRFK